MKQSSTREVVIQEEEKKMAKRKLSLVLNLWFLDNERQF